MLKFRIGQWNEHVNASIAANVGAAGATGPATGADGGVTGGAGGATAAPGDVTVRGETGRSGPYLFFACLAHAARFAFGCFLHAFSALVSFCARVGELAVMALPRASDTPTAIKQASMAVIASVDSLWPITSRWASRFMVIPSFDCT
jgi:hypothetical protein